jgi:hypothetical protein
MTFLCCEYPPEEAAKKDKKYKEGYDGIDGYTIDIF